MRHTLCVTREPSIIHAAHGVRELSRGSSRKSSGNERVTRSEIVTYYTRSIRVTFVPAETLQEILVLCAV